MSKELADRFERDLSAPDQTIERARRVRKECAALDIDWELAFEVYDAQANQDPKKFVRFPEQVYDSQESNTVSPNNGETESDGDNRYESAASR